ncbi:MAG: MATE family efflux transporter, partial [Clostridia bacterium]|nr:MATE family efflux transporter [Clostridia bacterium]
MNTTKTSHFYRRVIALMIPVLLQNGITNLVNMLDNVMVGSVGTGQMTGVSVASQLLFIFNLTIFGAVSGAGIFGAQFFGSGDTEGLRQTFRFKIIMGAVITAV